MTTKETTLAKLLGDPDNQALFNMDNVEEYNGYDIYDQDGKTLATKLVNGGVHALHTDGTGETVRVAMRAEVDRIGL